MNRLFNILFIITLYFYIALAALLGFFIGKTKNSKNKVLFLAVFFPGNSGYHWRAKEWQKQLELEGFEVDVKHAIEENEFYNYKDTQSARFMLIFLHRRFWQVIASRKYNKVIVRRELLLYNDYGKLFLDKLLLKIHPDAILDFDDDIAIAKREPRKISSLYGRLLQENGTKFTDSVKLYQNFIAGSHYLKNYVLERNKTVRASDILVLPTCVNYENFEPKKYNLEKKTITFGWVGGNHNLFLLETIIEPLNRLNERHDIELLVIAGKEYKHSKAQFKILNSQWSLETEKRDIKSIDIGLMPLLNTDRDKGKCSFKLIQYMGLGVVSIASGVGMNLEVIDEKKEQGFLVEDFSWLEKMEETIAAKDKWQNIGDNSRRKVLESYSYSSNLPKLIAFLSKQSN